jgi:hypothetical protein
MLVSIVAHKVYPLLLHHSNLFSASQWLLMMKFKKLFLQVLALKGVI